MAIPVLQALDQAKTQSYHFKTIVISGMGFFTDSYDIYVIGILIKLLGRIYYYDPSTNNPGVLPINLNAAVIGAALCGTLVGQLFFGWAGDKWGRKRVYGLTLLLMVIASLGQGLSFGRTSTSVIATLCFFRFWLGFGVGGDYPLSATIMAEYSNKKTRGAFVAAVFAMQGIGYLAAGIVTIVVTAIFMNANPRPAFDDPSIKTDRDYSTAPVADWVWRIVLMFGALPAILTFYSRSQMPETARYTALIEKNQAQAALDMERVLQSQISGGEFPKAAKTQAISHREFGLFTRQFVRRHGLHLFGTCMTWFLLDISYYSQSLFQSAVLSDANWLPNAKTMSALEETFKSAKWQTLLSLFSTIPGYWFTVFLVDRVGRKPIALMGFFFMSLFMYVLAFGWYRYSDGSRHRWDFIVLYGLTFFFSNFGPNATTFIIPAELYPARLRSTCHGISSAAGKAGAIVGAFGFLFASQTRDKHAVNKYSYPTGIGPKDSFILLASCSVVGFIVQLLCVPETMGRSLEDISGEDADNAVAYEDNAISYEQSKTQEAA